MASPAIIQFTTIQIAAMREAMNNITNNTNNNTPLDAQFGHARVAVNLMIAPELITGPQLSRSMSLPPPRLSLIDNKLAQACSLKRARVSSPIPSPQIKKSKSESSIIHHSPKYTYKNRTPGSTVKIVSSSSTEVRSSDDNMCPYTFIASVLIGEQPDSDEESNQLVKQMQPLHATEFLDPTAEQIAAYSTDAITAVRTSDIEALRKILSKGQTLQCCNRFGESLLHVACRRSNADVVSFLLNEADVSPRIKDDYGRTPLHDACWRGNPEYAIVELLLSIEPRLAFVPDVRGHKPFQYARREHWGAWKEFLDEKRDLILS